MDGSTLKEALGAWVFTTWKTNQDALCEVDDDETAERLLKIGSAPLKQDGRVVGRVQISTRPRQCAFYSGRSGCDQGSRCFFRHDEPEGPKRPERSSRPEPEPEKKRPTKALADPRAKRRKSDSETETSASSLTPPPSSTPTTSLLDIALSVQSWQSTVAKSLTDYQLAAQVDQARLVAQMTEQSRLLVEQTRVIAEQGRIIAELQASRHRQAAALADLQASRDRHRAQLTQVFDLHQRVVALEARQ